MPVSFSHALFAAGVKELLAMSVVRLRAALHVAADLGDFTCIEASPEACHCESSVNPWTRGKSAGCLPPRGVSR